MKKSYNISVEALAHIKVKCSHLAALIDGNESFFVEAVNSELISKDFSRAFNRCAKSIKTFINSFDSFSKNQIIFFDEIGLLSPCLHYILITAEKSSSLRRQVHPRDGRFLGTQCAEYLTYSSTGILLDEFHDNIVAVRCVNFGPYIVKARSLDGGNQYLWTRSDTSWAYTGTEKIRIDLSDWTIDFDIYVGESQTPSVIRSIAKNLLTAVRAYASFGNLAMIENVLKGEETLEPAFFFEGFWHIGHEIWNSFSAAQFFKSNGVIFDHILAYHGRCLHGNIADLWGDLAENISLFAGDADINRYLAENPRIQTFVTRHDFVSEAQSRHVSNHLDLPEEAKTRFADLDEQGIVVCFGIRCGARECTNMVEIILASIVQLQADFGDRKLVVLIDGTQDRTPSSPNVVFHNTHSLILKDNEQEIISQIRRSCAEIDVQFYETSGMSYPESVHITSKASLFISPWGAGLVKTCWVGRIPGIVYGNAYILKSAENDQGEYNIYNHPHWVESPSAIHFTPSRIIEREDNEGTFGKNSNYTLNCEDFLVDLRTAVRALLPDFS